MPDFVTKEKEKDFQEWLKSINFVNPDGKLRPIVLTEDTSDDPEGDRETKK